MGKKDQSDPSTKTKNKAKDKTINDLTFGLKNKNKSKVVQQYCKEVTNRVQFSDVKGGAKAAEEQKRNDKELKTKKQMHDDLIANLFKAVTEVAVTEEGVIDKKMTLCPYFKAGVCEKGKKCKYSHDMSVADAKQSNIDIYTDPRTKSGKAPIDTIITCKNFIESVENDKYGFNWQCPAGGDGCQYMHRLPQGYVLQKDTKGLPEDENSQTLEEKIEEERSLLQFDKCTPVTFETFMKWKADKKKKKEDEYLARIEQEKNEGAKKGNKKFGFMSGKALFSFDPNMFEDDDEAADDLAYEADLAKANADDTAVKNNQEEETKEETKVDEAAFVAEAGDLEEEVDFD